jgi:O-antigen ligase
MGNGITGLLFGIGFGGWIYYKMMRQTGGNTKNSIIVAFLAGLVGFFIIYTLIAQLLPQ